MISRFRDRFGTAGLIVAVLALIAAVAGTALAAGGLTKQQEKRVKQLATPIAKKYAGKEGPPGPQGNPGSAGAPGEKGKDGTNGTNGKGVVIGTASGIECGEGGNTVEVEGSGVKHAVCNGEDGAPGTDGENGACSNANPDCTLPSNATETGTWGVNGAGKFASFSSTFIPISFTLPLGAPLGSTKVHLISSNGNEVKLNESTFAMEQAPPTEGCGSALTPAGTVGNPAAAPGHLCIYSQQNVVSQPNVLMGSNLIHTPASVCEGLGCTAGSGGPGGGTAVSGAILSVLFSAEEKLDIWGTWAVTGAP